MKLTNKISQTDPVIIHYPYPENNEVWNVLLRQVFKNSEAYKCPDELEIITFNNRKQITLLEQVCRQHGVPLTVLGKKVDRWTNRRKIDLCLDQLKITEKPYILGLDADDVILLQDAPQIALDRFLGMNCKAIYNASSCDYPGVKPYKEVDLKLKPKELFRHLNSGCFIGETKFLLDVYREAFQYTDQHTEHYSPSDQVKIRPIYHKKAPELAIDDKCEIFQVLYVTPSSGMTSRDVFSLNVKMLI